MFSLSIFLTYVFVVKSEENVNKNLETTLNTCGKWVPKGDKLCYYKQVYDDIPQIKEKSFRFSEHTIFFIESTCNGGLNSHQACSVEAAARTHPHRDVVILFVGPVHKHCLNISPLSELLRYDNIKVFRLNVTKYFKSTPLQALVSKEANVGNISPVYRAPDVLKYVTLYKYGGVYLDLNVMVVKTLDFLPQPLNWAVKEDSDLSPSFLALSKHGIGRKVSYEILKLLKDIFRKRARRYGNVLVDILHKICKTKDVKRMSASSCQGLGVYDSAYFYTINLQDRSSYFATHNGNVPKDLYAFRFWNHSSLSDTIYNDSLYAERTKDHCPLIHEVMIIFDNAR